MKPLQILNKRINFVKIFIPILLISCNIFSETKTFTAAASNNWNNGSNWNPEGVPSSTDAVIIPGGKTCLVDPGTSCASLTFENGAASTLNIQWFFRTLTVLGSVTINNSASINIGLLSTLNIRGALIVNGSVTFDSDLGWLSLGGGLSNNGTIATSGLIIYQFTNDQTITGIQVRLSGNVNIGDSIILTNNTNLSVTGNINGNNSGSRFVNSAGATLNISGTLLSTGILDADSQDNTINYNGNNQTLKEADYNNLSLSGSGTKSIPVSDEPFNVNGNLTIGNGTTLNGNNRIINIKGNWTNNAAFINTNSVTFNGTTAQTIGGTASTSFDTLIINNSSGINLFCSQSVDDLLQLTSGKISTSSTNILTISAAGSISGGSDSSFINGPLSRIKNTAAQQILTYPLGKGNSYRPVELIIAHSDTTLAGYRAEVFNNAPVSRTLPGTLSSVSSVRYWNVTKTGSAVVTSAYITLYYGVEDGVTEPQDLRIAKENGSAWIDLGGTANGSPAGSILSNQFTTFSDFVLANVSGGANPLPVELASFTATAASKENEIILKWTTKTEMQNYGFEVERCKKPEQTSEAQCNWENIGFVKGSGNSNSPKEYYFVDQKINSGIYLFRLKQLDTDGSFEYSGELEVSIANIAELFVLEQNYPNPFNPSTTIKFAVNEASPVSIKVYDALGKEIKTIFNETAESGRFYSVEFDGSDCSSGVYYYAISGNNYNAVKKMVLIK